MCLILFAWQAHPDYPLVVAANRDEFLTRPTQAADFWLKHPQVLAGIDLQGGGTWMGITRTGRFAALTNYRDPAQTDASRPSRGRLVADFLTGASSPTSYLRETSAYGASCNGYNLLLAEFGSETMLWSSNLAPESIDGQFVSRGVHGLSNHLLNTDWPKVGAGRTALEAALQPGPDIDALFHLLQDQTRAADEHLPATGVPLEWERALSSAMVRTPGYGTRSSTVILVRRDGQVVFEEQIWSDGVTHPASETRRRYEFSWR